MFPPLRKASIPIARDDLLLESREPTGSAVVDHGPRLGLVGASALPPLWSAGQRRHSKLGSVSVRACEGIAVTFASGGRPLPRPLPQFWGRGERHTRRATMLPLLPNLGEEGWGEAAISARRTGQILSALERRKTGPSSAADLDPASRARVTKFGAGLRRSNRGTPRHAQPERETNTCTNASASPSRGFWETSPPEETFPVRATATG
jgi:hypothetical protein